MKVHFICGYYSDLAHRLKKRPEDYWDAYFFVWAVKIGSFRKSFFIHTAKGKVQITKNNFAKVRGTFGTFVEQTLDAEGWTDARLIPMPSKDAVPGVEDSRSANMVREAMSGTKYSGAVLNALHWKKQLSKAHEGGTRDREYLEQLLDVDPKIKQCRVVLVDDLLSTGASLLAAETALSAAGAQVLGAVTCGRTVFDFATKHFGRQAIEFSEEIAEYQQALQSSDR